MRDYKHTQPAPVPLGAIISSAFAAACLMASILVLWGLAVVMGG